MLSPPLNRQFLLQLQRPPRDSDPTAVHPPGPLPFSHRGHPSSAAFERSPLIHRDNLAHTIRPLTVIFNPSRSIAVTLPVM